jgi:hypothetical protein
LLIGEARVFDFRSEIVYSTCFNKSKAELWLRERSVLQQRESLLSAGITHVLVSWSEIERYRSPGNYGFSPWPEKKDMQQLVESGVLKPVDWQLDEKSHQLFEVVNATQL